MAEDLRSRMDGVLQEIERLTTQAEEWQRIAQEGQARLEELDLLVRQRDEQLAERQSRVEELEETLRQREEELGTLRGRLRDLEEASSRQEQELETWRARLAEQEATAAALREEVARTAVAAATAEAQAPPQALLEQVRVLAAEVRSQGQALASLRLLVEEGLGRLEGHLQRFEAGPPPAAVAEAAAALAAVEAPVAPVPIEAVEAPQAVALVPPEPLAPPEGPLQATLYEALASLPQATCLGLASLDGLAVEACFRREQAAAFPLEIELADLTTEAVRVASALGTGPLLTLAFQIGAERCLISPVGADHFAFLLTPADSDEDFRRTQAILLQTALRLGELP